MSITAETRRESYGQLDNATINMHIVSLLSNGAELTAKQIAVEMYKRSYIGYPMRQAVAPRLTEMVADGVLKVTGKAHDSETNRKVALYKLVRI